MLKKAFSKVVIGAVALSSLAAYAEVVPNYSTSSPYVGLQGVYGFMDKMEKVNSGGKQDPTKSRSGYGAKLTFGFSVDPALTADMPLAIEANYIFLHGLKNTDNSISSVNSHIGNLLFKVSLPLSEDASVFIGAGPSYILRQICGPETANHKPHKSFGAAAQIGAKYRIDEGLFVILTADYNHPISGEDAKRPTSLFAVSLGLQYNIV